MRAYNPEGTLTLAEFCKLPREEQNRRYAELSDHDKFGARQMDVSCTGPYVPCNDCVHDHRDGTCDAFPEGLLQGTLKRVMKDINSICRDGIKFEKR